MRLAVLGTLPMAAVTAAWAAANAGTEVVYVSDVAPPGKWSTQVTWDGTPRHAQIERVRVGSHTEADAFLLIASREESITLTRQYADSMRGKPVVLAPGGFAIVEAIDKILNTGTSAPSSLGQLPGFPVTGDIELDNVRIRSVKQNFPLGQLGTEDSSVLVATFRPWIPDVVRSTLTETALSSTNNLIHPPVLLANAARTEAGEEYLFYREGLSAGAARMICGVDDERLEILRALNQEAVPLTGWFRRYYGAQGLVGETVQEMLVNRPSLADSRGPKTLKHRYVSEDVVYGLAPMEELARRLNVATPFLSALITALSTVCESDLRAAAPRLVDESTILPMSRFAVAGQHQTPPHS